MKENVYTFMSSINKERMIMKKEDFLGKSMKVCRYRNTINPTLFEWEQSNKEKSEWISI